jgi:exodeoxyribonuclease VII large subunit
MTDRGAVVERHHEQLLATRTRGRTRLESLLARERDGAGHLGRHLRAVSPQHTLERGYAVVRHPDGVIVRDREEVEAGELLRVTVARGDFAVRPVS